MKLTLLTKQILVFIIVVTLLTIGTALITFSTETFTTLTAQEVKEIFTFLFVVLLPKAFGIFLFAIGVMGFKALINTFH